MSIQKSMQQIVVEFIQKHKKKFIFFILMCSFVSIMASVRNNQIENAKIEFTESFSVVLDLAEEKKIENALNVLSCIEKKHKNSYKIAKLENNISLGNTEKRLKNYFNQEMLLLILRVKLENLRPEGLSQKTKRRIKNLDYISQSTDYKDFSVCGEWLLMYKMYLHLLDKEYNECDAMLFKYNIQKLPHLFTRYQRAIALFYINPDKAKDVLIYELNNSFGDLLINRLETVGVFSDKK